MQKPGHAQAADGDTETKHCLGEQHPHSPRERQPVAEVADPDSVQQLHDKDPEHNSHHRAECDSHRRLISGLFMSRMRGL